MVKLDKGMKTKEYICHEKAIFKKIVQFHIISWAFWTFDSTLFETLFPFMKMRWKVRLQ